MDFDLSKVLDVSVLEVLLSAPWLGILKVTLFYGMLFGMLMITVRMKTILDFIVRLEELRQKSCQSKTENLDKNKHGKND